MRYVGLDVHAETFCVAVADKSSVTYVGKYPFSVATVHKVLKRLGTPHSLKVAYEAGPTGYTLYRELVAAGIETHVVAPTLIPVKSGDRVKTDRRDAEKIARCLRSGDLTDVWVPSVETEALRDLVRAREDAKADQLRARHRLSKFLLRHNRQRPKDMKKSWTVKHLQWVRQQSFAQCGQQACFDDYVAEVEHAASRVAGLEEQISKLIPTLPERLCKLVAGLQSMRGIGMLTAVTLVSEVESFGRFESPRQLMAYAGVVPSESSSGGSTRRGSITKTGNAHLRRVVVEAAWNARYRPALSYPLRQRQSSNPKVRETAWNAQKRLHQRYMALKVKGKEHNKVLIAVAREMLGFIWDIGNTIEHTATRETMGRIA
jgi:transposase